MDFRVGDRVLVTTHLSDYELSDGHMVCVNSFMLNYEGGRFVIGEVKRHNSGENIYRLKRNGQISLWWFVDKWLIHVIGRVDRY